MIVELEKKLQKLEAGNSEKERMIKIVRKDYETVNDKLMEVHAFVKTVSENRGKFQGEAKTLLPPDVA